MESIDKISELKIGHGTHEGMSGKHNEDSYGFFAWKLDGDRSLHLGIVADGIGGQAAGEMASTVAVEAIKRYFDKQDTVEDVSKHLERAIIMANRAVYRASEENPQFQGMGTTIVLAALLDNRLFTAYVGDSRAYLFRSGELKQLTVDHTWAQEAIEAGLLTREQAKTHPNRNVIKRYLGVSQDVEVDHRLLLEIGQSPDVARANQGLRIHPGDTILLCSDGLTDMIDDSAVLASLVAHDTLQPAVDEMIDKANEAGGRDNITLVAMQMPSTPAAAVPPTPVSTPANSTPVAAPAGGQGSGIGIPLLLVGGIGALLLIGAILVGGFIFLRNGNGDGDPGTPQGTSEPAVGDDPTTDAPATAGAVEGESGPAAGETTPGSEGELLATPTQRPPDLLETFTPTNTPRPRATQLADTATPDTAVTNTPTSGGGGGGGGDQPNPTNTPVTPTVTPPLPGATATSPPAEPTDTKEPEPTLGPRPTDPPPDD